MSSGSLSLGAFGEKDIKDEGRRVDERERQRRGSERKGRTLDKMGSGGKKKKTQSG